MSIDFQKIRPERGAQIAVELLFLSAIVVVLIAGFVSLASSFLQLSVRAQNKLQAFQIAEAGIEYYRWHLAHAPTDYWDGNSSSTPGPYVHNYYDKEGDEIGQFSLVITPPPPNSSVVTIQSTGKVLADDSITKVIQVKMVRSNLLAYNIVQASDLLIGTSTTIYGPVMSNGGVHFDGLALGLVQSAESTYQDSSENGDATEWAVHTDVSPADPQPPTVLPLRTDVFAAGREVSVPSIDFTALTGVLSNVQTLAENGGVYEPSSGVYGYDLAFSTSTNPATTTYTLYQVTSIAAPPNGCTNVTSQSGWGTWSIGAETQIATGTIPANGAFFFNDNVWVRGQIDSAHIVVGSAVFPDNSQTWTNIIVNQSLQYTHYDGSDSMVLIAQNNVNVGLYSDDTLRIDGALVAEHGRVGRFFYKDHQGNSNRCAPYATRTQVTTYGTIITDQSYEFGYDDGTGYADRQLLYDINLFYDPPSVIPSVTNFSVVSWEEVQ